MSGVHQFVPMLHRHDAVGEHTRALRDLLVADGVESRIYTEHPDPATAHETRPYLEYADDAAPGDVLVYQMATASAIAGWLLVRPEPLVVNYHSVTPPAAFAPWNNGIARIQTATLIELPGVASRADLGIAVSRFDEAELVAAGCTRTEVIPVVNATDPPTPPDPAAAARLAEARRRREASGPAGGWWLSVGRIAPNKRHHATVAALFAARASTDPGAHLTIVGAPTEPAYLRALRRYIAMLDLDDAVDLVSGIPDGELAAFYRECDVLVMLSDHEGFGVPLVEAMAHGLPVVAYDAGAVAEVLDGAGVLLDVTHPRQVASVVTGVVTDAAARAQLVAGGTERVARLDLPSAGPRLVAAVRSVAGGADGGPVGDQTDGPGARSAEAQVGGGERRS